ncbi:hypothetical protein Mapa_008399 [Marchantia paleacea]|nr:hypothetical protein Mapa_008399 [Marchantia paleacea]
MSSTDIEFSPGSEKLPSSHQTRQFRVPIQHNCSSKNRLTTNNYTLHDRRVTLHQTRNATASMNTSNSRFTHLEMKQRHEQLFRGGFWQCLKAECRYVQSENSVEQMRRRRI